MSAGSDGGGVARAAAGESDGGSLCGLLNLTVRCNQDCLFCCDGERKESGHHLSAAEARERVEKLAAQGVESVTFIGGEPLLLDYLPGLVARARELGLRAGLTTNGTLLTEERLNRLLEAGLTSLEISIHTFQPALADRISRRRGTAARQQRALELLRERRAAGKGLGVSVNFVIFSGNYGELPGFAAEIVQRYSFIDELFINFLDPVGYPALDPSLIPAYREVAPPLRQALGILERAHVPFTVDSVPGCILGPFALFLRAVRERLRGIRYCKQAPDIRASEPDDDRSQYYRVNACHDCFLASLCPGVNFRYLERRGAAEFRPADQEPAEPGALRLPPEAPPGLVRMLGREAARIERNRAQPVTVMLTDRCNNNCDSCHCRGLTPPPPARLAHRLAALADRPPPRPVLLAGGEPALHPRFHTILSHLSRSGCRVGFTTNGRLFTIPDRVRQAAAAGASFVRLVLPSPLSALDRVTQVAGAEEQSRQGIRNLVSRRSFHLEALVAVPPGTEAELPATMAWLQELGIYRVL